MWQLAHSRDFLMNGSNFGLTPMEVSIGFVTTSSKGPYISSGGPSLNWPVIEFARNSPMSS